MRGRENGRRTLVFHIAAVVAVCLFLAGMVPTLLAQDNLYFDSDSDTSGPESNAKALYGAGQYEVLSVENKTNSTEAFEDQFPSYKLYYAIQTDYTYPAYVDTFVESGSGDAYDIMEDYNALLADAGTSILSSDDALSHAKIIAQHTNSDLSFGGEIVDSSDSGRLGIPLDDPDVTNMVTEYEVKLHTWSEENGIVSNWTIRLASDSLIESEQEIPWVAQGNFNVTKLRPDIRPGTSIINDYTSGHEREIFRSDEVAPEGMVELDPYEKLPRLNWSSIGSETNFDGTEWTVHIPQGEDAGDHITWANNILNASTAIYQRFVSDSPSQCASVTNPDPNWSLSERNTDCSLDIRIVPDDFLACAACVEYGDNVTLYVAEAATGWMEVINYYEENHPYTSTDIAKEMISDAYLGHLIWETPEDHPQINKPDNAGDRYTSDGNMALLEFPLQAFLSPSFDTIYEEATSKGAFYIGPNETGTREIIAYVSEEPSTWNESIIPRSWNLTFSQQDVNWTENLQPVTNLDTNESWPLETLEVPPDPPLGSEAFIYHDLGLPAFNETLKEEAASLQDLIDGGPFHWTENLAKAKEVNHEGALCETGLETDFGAALSSLDSKVDRNLSVNTDRPADHDLEQVFARVADCMSRTVGGLGFAPSEAQPLPNGSFVENQLTVQHTWDRFLNDTIDSLESLSGDIGPNSTLFDGARGKVCWDADCLFVSSSPENSSGRNGTTFVNNTMFIISEGDNTYNNDAGASAGAMGDHCENETGDQFPLLSVVIDLWGDDSYIPDSSPGLSLCSPSIGSGLYGGVGYLLDMGGEDKFESSGLTMGAGMLGGAGTVASLNQSEPGVDTFLMDGGSGDYTGWGMGLGMWKGIGVLVSEGNTTYNLTGEAPSLGTEEFGALSVKLTTDGIASLELPGDLSYCINLACAWVYVSCGGEECAGDGAHWAFLHHDSGEGHLTGNGAKNDSCEFSMGNKCTTRISKDDCLRAKAWTYTDNTNGIDTHVSVGCPEGSIIS